MQKVLNDLKGKRAQLNQKCEHQQIRLSMLEDDLEKICTTTVAQEAELILIATERQKRAKEARCNGGVWQGSAPAKSTSTEFLLLL